MSENFPDKNLNPAPKTNNQKWIFRLKWNQVALKLSFKIFETAKSTKKMRNRLSEKALKLV